MTDVVCHPARWQVRQHDAGLERPVVVEPVDGVARRPGDRPHPRHVLRRRLHDAVEALGDVDVVEEPAARVETQQAFQPRC
eukprot:4539364-Pyramimonas_sp.AAC.1